MAAVRTYGIPRVVEAREIFLFNCGQGKLKINFTGGVPDPKYNIPATYSTANELEQIIIEQSLQFGEKVFRYLSNGEVISKSSFDIAKEAEKTKKEIVAEKIKDKTKVYDEVETIGQATEVLLELGVKADDLNGQEAVVAAMMRKRVSFPNLKF